MARIKKAPVVGVIMDGNRTFGRTRLDGPLQGHKIGAEVAEAIVREAVDQGVKTLILYAWSTENWSRSSEEVKHIFDLFRMFFSGKCHDLIKEGVKVSFIGRRDRVPIDVRFMMNNIERRSSKNKLIHVVIAIDYGGRDEIERAVRRLVWRVLTLRVAPWSIARSFRRCLDTGNLPDVDLIIRTSGEQRVSGFLAWLGTYAELYFTPVCWPEFTRAHFRQALEWYYQRDRRLGGDSQKVAAE